MPEVLWRPHPKQAVALSCPVYELFYGGGRGAGKSAYLLMDFMKLADTYGRDHKGIVFRKTYPELEELQFMAMNIYPRLGATYHAGERTWTFPKGATLKMRHLERDADVQHYRGQSYSAVAFDELTDWATDFAYIYMHSCARSAAGVPVTIRATGNPGGPGHVWVKQRFVEIGEPMQPHADEDTGLLRVFIPALLDDNPTLMKNDPNYELRLKALPEHLYKAYRFGDWDIFAGQAFEEWDKDVHVSKPFPINPNWFRFASGDWGYAKPYAIQWWAVTGDGRMILYRDWYGCDPKKHNVGIKRAADNLASESWATSVAEGCRDIVLDPACWSKTDEGQSIAEKFEAAGWATHKGINDRKSGIARMHEIMKMRLDDGRAGLIVFDTCRGFIRTFPSLVLDVKDPENYDTNGEDHEGDAFRYAAMSRLVSRRVSNPDKATAPTPTPPPYDPLRYGLKRR